MIRTIGHRRDPGNWRVDVIRPRCQLAARIPAGAAVTGAMLDVLMSSGRFRPWTIRQKRCSNCKARFGDRLEEADYLVERLSYFNTWLFPAVAAIRSFRRLWPRRQEAAASDFSTPPHILNRALSGLFASEARFLRTRSLPFGVSLIALGRKAGG